MRFQVPAFLVLVLALLPASSGLAQQQNAALAPSRADFAASIPDSNRIAFRVIRDDVEIGRHELVFRRAGDKLEVDVAIDLKVTFLGVALYRYSHRAQETWQGDRLVVLETSTDDNGKPHKVSGRAADAAFLVTTSGTQSPMPADLLPSSHWNRAWLEGKPLLNTQTGERIAFSVIRRGPENVATATGSVAAEHFSITGDLRKEIWFDSAGRWVKTSFAAPDGSTISYVLQ